jgi:hypothetical protein
MSRKTSPPLLTLLILPLLPLLLLPFAPGARAFSDGPVRLVYAESSTAGRGTKEYLLRPEPGGGWRIVLREGRVERVIVCDAALDTLREEYRDPASGDSLTMRREGDALRLTGTREGRAVDRSFPLEAPWYGSVLLLRAFVLSDAPEALFHVSKPEAEQVVLLRAIRQGAETVEAGGRPVEAVRAKYTVPGVRGLFWSSLYWYRASDGLLVRTEETRGGPGTPTVFAELLEAAPAPGALGSAAPGPGLAGAPPRPALP